MTAHLGEAFRRLHEPGQLLVLPNAWDAGTARLIERCGAAAIATTSAGLAWACGYPDGDALPPRVLAAAVAAIARVISVPLTVDAEGGYSTDPRTVGEVVAALVDAGAVGVNLEDGADPPDVLCAKITAAKDAGTRAGVDVFVNARTDVYRRRPVAEDRLAAETIARAERYREAGCDGLFVPFLVMPDAIRAVASAVSLPLNVMVVPTLPPVAELRALGVRRVSAGAAIAQAAFGLVQRAASEMLNEGVYGAMLDRPAVYANVNQLFSRHR